MHIHLHHSLHDYFMQRALMLAQLPLGKVSPNPYVGAVIVKNQVIIGEGYHHGAGTPHAEIHALKQAGTQAHGASLYVTLEPCCHQGRTGPCTQRIIDAGIAEVIYSIDDPNPLVSGKGAQILRNAGIRVISGIGASQAQLINRIFVHQQNYKRPYVLLKAGMSLDGKLATQTGESQWITGILAREKAHQIRQECDAILIGAGTLHADNPQLTVRTTTDPKQPTRIVMLSNFNLVNPDAALFDTTISPTFILYPASKTTSIPIALRTQLQHQNVQLVPLQHDPTSPNYLHPDTVLAYLHQQGIGSVLIEGGARIHNAFLNAQCVDEIALFYGNCLIGNNHAPSLWQHSAVNTLIQSPRFHLIESTLLYDSVLIRGLALHNTINGKPVCLQD